VGPREPRLSVTSRESHDITPWVFDIDDAPCDLLVDQLRGFRGDVDVEAVTGEEVVDDVDFFFSSRIRHTRSTRDWSSDVCSSDLLLDLDHVEPEGRLDDVAQAAPLEGEGGLLECRCHAAAREQAQVAAIRRRARILGPLLGRSEERRVGKEWPSGGSTVLSRRSVD